MRQEFVRGKRRYILSLDVDLFDACVINRHWYGETNRRHGRRQELFTDLDLAKVRFTAVQAYLLKRGYEYPPTVVLSEGRGQDERSDPVIGFCEEQRSHITLDSLPKG